MGGLDGLWMNWNDVWARTMALLQIVMVSTNYTWSDIFWVLSLCLLSNDFLHCSLVYIAHSYIFSALKKVMYLLFTKSTEATLYRSYPSVFHVGLTLLCHGRVLFIEWYCCRKHFQHRKDPRRVGSATTIVADNLNNVFVPLQVSALNVTLHKCRSSNTSRSYQFIIPILIYLHSFFVSWTEKWSTCLREKCL